MQTLNPGRWRWGTFSDHRRKLVKARAKSIELYTEKYISVYFYDINFGNRYRSRHHASKYNSIVNYFENYKFKKLFVKEWLYSQAS